MALYQRRESGGRTRFLLALSLSTLTAIAVAAPLAIEAVRAEESTFAANDPLRGGGTAESDTGDELGSNGDRTLDRNDDAMGGIGSRPQAKAQGQTSKTEGDETTEPPAEDPPEAVLTNPDEEPAEEPVEEPVEEPAGPTTTAETVPEPESTTTTGPDESTTTTDPDESTTTTDPDGSTTTDPDESTTTTDPDESTTTDPEDPQEPSDSGSSSTTADSPPAAP